jgi:AcrR family transcriptional regulator
VTRAAAAPGRRARRRVRARTSPSPRAALSRDAIAEAGLHIAREGDLERVTMARLAEALGVTPMALYRHFRSKSELVDAILDRFVRESAVTSHGTPGSDARAWLAATFGAMHRALAGTPGVMPYLSSGWRFGEASRAVLDEVLGVLHAAGLPRRAAVEAMGALLAFTIGSAGLAAAWGRSAPADLAADAPAERRRRLRSRFAAVSRARYPNLVDSAGDMAVLASPPHAFDAGIRILLAGLALR